MKVFASTLIVFLLSFSASAAETIRLVWPYSLESYWQNGRTIAENANASQTKYNFVSEIKQGAGGTIAAQYVLANPNTAIFSNAVSHIVKPITNPREAGYDLDSFQPVLVQVLDVPLVMVSKKYKTMSELLAQPKLNIGISAAGGVTDYAARVMVNKPDAQFVSFKTGFPEQVAGVLGGHLDGAVVTIDSSKRFIDAGSLMRLADSPLTMNCVMYASTKMDPERTREIHEILTAASNQDNVRKILVDASPKYVYWNLARLQEWYAAERIRWVGIAAKHPLK